MAELIDPAWEYYAGDAEVEELLAEASGGGPDLRTDRPGTLSVRNRCSGCARRAADAVARCRARAKGASDG